MGRANHFQHCFTGRWRRVARGLVVASESGHDPSAAERNVSTTSLIAVLGYGVTPKLAVFGVLPYVDKDIDMIIGGNRVNRGTSSLGDLTIFGRYTLVQRDKPGRTFRVAPFLGFKAPTGDDDKTDSLGRLPAPVQSSSGAWAISSIISLTLSPYNTV